MRRVSRKLLLAGVAVLTLGVAVELMVMSAVVGTESGRMADAPESLAAEHDRIDDVLTSDRSDWQKALELTRIVRAALPTDQGYYCDQYADWLVDAAGGSLRMRTVTAIVDDNTLDSHTTAEVWLPAENRWAIVDPTFGGYFTVGGRPVGAHDIQRLLLDGEADRVYWRSLHSKNTSMLSSYIVDPTLLFRRIQLWLPTPDGRIARAESPTSRRATRSLRGPAPVYGNDPDLPRFPKARES